MRAGATRGRIRRASFRRPHPGTRGRIRRASFRRPHPISSRAMSPPRKESKGGQRATTLAVIVLFAFGLIVPALVLANNGEDHASTDLGVHLTKQEIKGRELFALKCTVCHTLAAVKSVGRTGPNLDVLVGGGSIPTTA